MLESSMRGGYAADDGVGLHFINGCLRHVVSSRPEAKGYRAELSGNTVTETPLDTKFLGNKACQQGGAPDALTGAGDL